MCAKRLRSERPARKASRTLADVVKRLDARKVKGCGFVVGDRVVHKDEPRDVGTIRRLWVCDWRGSSFEGEVFALIAFRAGKWGGPLYVIRHVKDARKKNRGRARRSVGPRSIRCGAKKIKS